MYLIMFPFIIAGLTAKIKNNKFRKNENTVIEHSNQETEIEYILKTFEDQLNSTEIWGSLTDEKGLFFESLMLETTLGNDSLVLYKTLNSLNNSLKLNWDGKNQNGLGVTPGIYFVKKGQILEKRLIDHMTK